MALSPDGSASGSLLLDDGESLDSVMSELLFNASSLSPSSFRFTSTVWSKGYTPPGSATLDVVRVLLGGLGNGKPQNVTSVLLNGQPQEASYDTMRGVLVVEQLRLPMVSALTLELSVGPAQAV